MLEAVGNLEVAPQHLLIDAMQLDVQVPQTSIIKGDANSLSIAAASIVAKVTRDRMMTNYELTYPGYDFAHNVGYGTQHHLEGLKRKGITPIHRPLTKREFRVDEQYIYPHEFAVLDPDGYFLRFSE